MLVTAAAELYDLPRGLGLLFCQSHHDAFGKAGGSVARKRTMPDRLKRSGSILGKNFHFDKIATTNDFRCFVTKLHVHSVPNNFSTSRQESSESDTQSRERNWILLTDETVSSGLRISDMPERVFLFCSYLWNKFLFRQSPIDGGA